jgi:hypothetical protein
MDQSQSPDPRPVTAQLCANLSLSIYREADQIRIVLANELEMLELTECYQINTTTKHLDAQGRGVERLRQTQRYCLKEAVVIALRRVVSEAFNQGLISDSLGEWKITKQTPSSSKPQEVEIDLSDSML